MAQHVIFAAEYSVKKEDIITVNTAKDIFMCAVHAKRKMQDAHIAVFI
jgi:hypothetical protein